MKEKQIIKDIEKIRKKHLNILKKELNYTSEQEYDEMDLANLCIDILKYFDKKLKKVD